MYMSVVQLSLSLKKAHVLDTCCQQIFTHLNLIAQPSVGYAKNADTDSWETLYHSPVHLYQQAHCHIFCPAYPAVSRACQFHYSGKRCCYHFLEEESASEAAAIAVATNCSAHRLVRYPDMVFCKVFLHCCYTHRHLAYVNEGLKLQDSLHIVFGFPASCSDHVEQTLICILVLMEQADPAASDILATEADSGYVDRMP